MVRTAFLLPNYIKKMQHFAALILICLINQPESEFCEDQFNTGIGEGKPVICAPDWIKISECCKYSAN